MDADTLVARGLACEVGNALQRPNRLLKKYLAEQRAEGGAISRLFNNADSYQKNFKGILERRIEQFDRLDPTLKRYLHRSIEDLPAHPDVSLTNVRGIVNHAFELIWMIELSDKRIPSEWFAIWRRNKERGIDDWQTAFPQGVHRVRLLNLMTGTQSSDPCAKHVTKCTLPMS